MIVGDSIQKITDWPAKTAIGDYVYEAYHAQKPGKVVKIVCNQILYCGYYDVTIKFIDGSVKTLPNCIVMDFMWLIESHKRKLRTHTSKLSKLVSL